MNDTPLVAELRRQNRWLKAIAIGSLATLAIAAAVPTPITDEITVRRINVVNADGTLSSVIAGRGRLPRVIHNGQPIGDERSEGGFIFYNAVGDETGGFVFDGAIADDGKPRGGLHFSMDRFGGDQQLVIAHGEGGGIMRTGLSIMDRGKPEEYEPIYEAMVKETDPERKAALQAAWVAAGGPQDRAAVRRAHPRQFVRARPCRYGRNTPLDVPRDAGRQGRDPFPRSRGYRGAHLVRRARIGVTPPTGQGHRPVR